MTAPLLIDAGVWIAAESPGLDLTLYEVANTIGARRGDAIGAAVACRSIVGRCKSRLVRIEAKVIEAAIEIAVEYRLSSYDAAYVAVARRHDWILVSTDIRDLVSKGLAVTPDAAV